MITERAIIGKIEVLEDGQIQLREDTVIERDGKEISRLYHRRALEPGTDITREIDTQLKDIAAIVWTPEVITAYRNKKAAAIEAAKDNVSRNSKRR